MKVREACFYMCANVIFAPFLPFSAISGAGVYANKPVYIWFPYLTLTLVFVRCQYYFSWVIGRVCGVTVRV
jgi:hypothetical protein